MLKLTNSLGGNPLFGVAICLALTSSVAAANIVPLKIGDWIGGSGADSAVSKTPYARFIRVAQSKDQDPYRDLANRTNTPLDEFRMEAQNTIFELLGRADLNFQIIFDSENPKYYRKAHFAWRMGNNMIGTLRIVDELDETATRILTGIKNGDGRSCKGRFLSQIVSQQDAEAHDLITVCDRVPGRGGVAVYYAITPRNQGGFYMISVASPAKHQERLQKRGVFLKDIAIELVNAR